MTEDNPNLTTPEGIPPANTPVGRNVVVLPLAVVRVLIASLFALVVATAVSGLLIVQRTDLNIQQVNALGTCQLEQIAEHRQSSASFFRQNADALGFEYERGDSIPQDIPADIAAACEAFFATSGEGSTVGGR